MISLLLASCVQLHILIYFGDTCFYCFAPSRLEKRVNKKVMAMFEKAEDEYNDLMSKKNIIEVIFNLFKHFCTFLA